MDGGPCPVALLKKICVGRMTKREEPVFLQTDGRALNYTQVSDVLTVLCTHFGLDRKFYTPHSLRIGAATDAYLQGLSLFTIMVKFNWKSKRTAMGYIRTGNEDLEKFENS